MWHRRPVAEDTDDPIPRDYATTDEVAAAAGVVRTSLGEWVRTGVLPKPSWTGGRGVIAKWPCVSLKIAAFVREQRELGFGLPEIRARIVAAFGDRVLEVLAVPHTSHAQGQKKGSRRLSRR